jgi:hypothetical protein
MKNTSKYITLENIFIFLFLLTFVMPYIRVEWGSIVYPKEYGENPTGLPRIIELSLLLLLCVQIVTKRITINKLFMMFKNDKFFRIFIFISLYILFQPFFLELFQFTISPTSKGVIRGNILLPLVAYIVGGSFSATEKSIKIFFLGLIIAGSLNAIAILYPALFPDYLFVEYSKNQPLWIFQGPITEVGRRAGFWDRSTQVATFMSILICLGVTTFLYFKSKIIKLVMILLVGLSVLALSSTLQRIQFVAVSFLFLYVFFNRIETSNRVRRQQKLLKLLIACLFITINILYPYIFLSRFSAVDHSLFQDPRTQIIWPAYIDFIFREPTVFLFGSGFTGDALNVDGNPMGLAHAHNQILGWFSGIGLFMTILFVYIFYILFKKTKAISNSYFLNIDQKLFSFFLKSIFITMFIICLAESPLQQEPIAILVFLAAGIVNALYEIHLHGKFKPANNC